MMISGNRRVPLVYSSDKQKQQQFFKYVPDKLRVIKFGCVCPQLRLTGVFIVAGTLGNNSANVDGIGTSAIFSNLYVMTDKDETTMFIADRVGSIIRTYNKNTNEVKLFAGNGSYGDTNGATLTTSTFAYINSLAYDSINNILYVATNISIRKINCNTNTVTTLLAKPASIDAFTSIAYKNGVVYGIDDSKEVVYTVDVNTSTFTIIAGTSGVSGFTNGTGLSATFNMGFVPSAITVDNSGNLYIADLGNSAIRKIVISTAAVTTLFSVSAIINVKYSSYDNCLYYTKGTGLFKFDLNNSVETPVVNTPYTITDFSISGLNTFYAGTSTYVLLNMLT